MFHLRSSKPIDLVKLMKQIDYLYDFDFEGFLSILLPRLQKYQHFSAHISMTMLQKKYFLHFFYLLIKKTPYQYF